MSVEMGVRGECATSSVRPVPDVAWKMPDGSFSFIPPISRRGESLPYSYVWQPAFGEFRGYLALSPGEVPWELNVARRLWEAHPSRYGFVPHSQPGVIAWWVSRSRDAACGIENIVDPMLLPAWDWSDSSEEGEGEGVGWFPPGVDPDEAGAQFLTFRYRTHGPVWYLNVVGVHGAVEEIRWNDVDRMRKVLHQATTQEPRDVIVERALLDSDAVRSGNGTRIYAAHTRRVRAEFASPLDDVDDDAVALVVEQVANEWLEGAGYAEVSPRRDPGLGWRLLHRRVTVSADGLSSPSPVRSLSAGAMMYVLPSARRGQEECDEEKVVGWAAERLRVLLQDSGLGRVVWVSMPRDGVTAVLITKRPDLVERFPAAFGVRAGCEVKVLEL